MPKVLIYRNIIVLLILGIGIFFSLRFFDTGRVLCKNCNILLVTMDTCAAHNIACYGYGRDTMPNFCTFAKDNVFFKNAYANAVWTLPSHASIFTGLLPKHNGIEGTTDRLSPRIPLLSDVLHQNGYETIFYMPNDTSILPVTNIYGRGMTQIDSDAYYNGTSTDKAIGALADNTKKGKKTFVSLYLSQCHEPYPLEHKPPIFTTDSIPGIPIEGTPKVIQFTDDFLKWVVGALQTDMKAAETNPELHAWLSDFYNRLLSANTVGDAQQIYQAMGDKNEQVLHYVSMQYTDYIFLTRLDPSDSRLTNYLRALYDQKLFEFDADIIFKIRAAITQTDLGRNTIVIMTSEHGQEFGEHGVIGHSTLYDLNLKVPMMMYVPRVKPIAIASNVQEVDIMPTVLQLVGIRSLYKFDGASLLPEILGQHTDERLIVANGLWSFRQHDLEAIRYGKWKMIAVVRDSEIKPQELYDTSLDPLEKDNVLQKQPRVALSIVRLYTLSSLWH